ncbi:MAG: flavin reductase family protein [Caulobacteraceae bacterium]
MADPVRDAEAPLSPVEWRAAMGCFPSGVTIVTSWRGETPVGATASSFCSVSLEPPLLLVCLDLSNSVLGPIESCGLFGINILGAGHRELALLFGRKPETGRFASAPFRAHPRGAPQLAAASVFVDCALEGAHVAGDHKIVVGRGVRIDHASPATPLLYHKGSFPSFEP